MRLWADAFGTNAARSDTDSHSTVQDIEESSAVEESESSAVEESENRAVEDSEENSVARHSGTSSVARTGGVSEMVFPLISHFRQQFLNGLSPFLPSTLFQEGRR